MANREIFESAATRTKPADTKNQAGGAAYQMPPELALAQMAAVGTFGSTFYASGKDQLGEFQRLVAEVDDLEFLAKLAVYARSQGYMKDTPAYLVAHVVLNASTDEERALGATVFRSVIDNGRMLRNFCQIVWSGVIGRKSLGNYTRRLVREWFGRQSLDYLFKQSVGKDPSLAGVLAMVRPKPDTNERRALYGYLRNADAGHNEKRYAIPGDLPALVQHYEAFKTRGEADVALPDVPFQMLDSLGLETKHWVELFRNGGYQFTRMNLNTAQRHGVFDVDGMTQLIADRLRDPEEVRKARQFPFQLMSAYKHATDIPRAVIDALHDAMELATANVPELPGKTIVAVDTSGSMGYTALGGGRGGYYTPPSVSALDVASLFAACVLRQNPDAEVILFDTHCYDVTVEPRDTIATMAKLFARNGGSTSCSAPLKRINQRSQRLDTFIIISDNQSWADALAGDATATAAEWRLLKKRCPGAKQVRIDVTPHSTSQTEAGRDDTLQVGGFSDRVFDVVASFADNHGADAWVRTIDMIDLNPPAA